MLRNSIFDDAAKFYKMPLKVVTFDVINAKDEQTDDEKTYDKLLCLNDKLVDKLFDKLFPFLPGPVLKNFHLTFYVEFNTN